MSCALLSGLHSRAQQPSNLPSLQQSATKDREAGNADQAIAEYQQALTLQPDWPEGLWYLGTMNYDLDRYAEAIPPLARLIQLAPDSSAAYSFLGLAEFETKDYPAARTHLETAQTLGNTDDPSLAQVSTYHLALLLNRDGEFDRAATLLHAAFPQPDPPAQAKAAFGIAALHIPLLPAEIDPSYDMLLESVGAAAALMPHDPSRSAAALAQLVAQNPNTPWLHEAWARALTATGQPKQSQAAQQQEEKLPHQHLADLYRIGPTPVASDDAAWKQAMADYSAARYPQTIAELKSWLKARPSDGTAWAVLGLAEFQLHDYDNALIHLQRGRQLGVGASPRAASLALDRLALLLNRTGQFDQALTVLASISQNAPTRPEIRLALGLALLRMPVLPADLDPARRPLVESAGSIAALLLASRYDEAFPQFQKLIAQYPHTPWLHYAYGTALESLSQFDEANEQMRAEAAQSPQSALPWIRLAGIALRRHQAAEALSQARTAVALAPQSADARYVLGRAWLESGNAQQAIPELEQAVALAPNSPEAHFALARAYSRASMSEKAQQQQAAFARLNALAEQQRASTGNQSYQGPREGAASILGAGTPGPGSSSPAAPQ